MCENGVFERKAVLDRKNSVDVGEGCSECGMLDVGCGMLGVQCWVLGVECGMLNVECGMWHVRC